MPFDAGHSAEERHDAKEAGTSSRDRPPRPPRADEGGKDEEPREARPTRKGRREGSPEDTSAKPVMEPLVVRRGDGKAPGGVPSEGRPSQLVEVDVEREVIGTSLCRERAIVDVVVEEDVAPAEIARRRRAARREARPVGPRTSRAREGLRATLGYKVFYDLVCNRLGVVLMGFGLALLLFSVLYDPLRREPLSIGPRQLMALVVAGVVYFVGMGLEMLRAWSWECEGELGTVYARRKDRAREGDAPIPLVPAEALGKLSGRVDDGERARGR